MQVLTFLFPILLHLCGSSTESVKPGSLIYMSTKPVYLNINGRKVRISQQELDRQVGEMMKEASHYRKAQTLMNNAGIKNNPTASRAI